MIEFLLSVASLGKNGFALHLGKAAHDQTDRLAARMHLDGLDSKLGHD